MQPQVGPSLAPRDRRPGRARRERPMTSGGDHASPLSRGRPGWPKCSLGSFRQNAVPLALMLRSIAAEPERRRFHGPSTLRRVSTHEGVVVLSLRDARTPVRVCETPPARALLRMRTAKLAARRRTVFGSFHLTMSNSPSRSRGAFFAPGALHLCFAHPTRGVGGAPRNVRVRAKHPWGTP